MWRPKRRLRSAFLTSDDVVLTDGTMTLERHLIRDQLHSEDIVMAYIPKDRLLICARSTSRATRVAPLTG